MTIARGGGCFVRDRGWLQQKQSHVAVDGAMLQQATPLGLDARSLACRLCADVLFNWIKLGTN